MIRILPESSGNVLGVQASAKLTDADYRTIWIPELERLIDAHGSVRVLFYMDETFSGWEVSALWEDAQFGLKHASAFDKIAIVGGPEWGAWSVKLLGHFIKGEIRSFANNQLDEAWSWVK